MIILLHKFNNVLQVLK